MRNFAFAFMAVMLALSTPALALGAQGILGLRLLRLHSLTRRLLFARAPVLRTRHQAKLQTSSVFVLPLTPQAATTPTD
jgi:hypothetical protein